MTQTQVRERPILFSGPMVRAILDGSKTQTRRVVKGVPRTEDDDLVRLECGHYHPTIIDRDGFEEPGEETFGAWTPDGEWATRCPYGQPGDRLWVRETWCDISGTQPQFAYRADPYVSNGDLKGQWRPSIFMPRAACRLTLEITEVRVQRLQDMNATDAIAEGIPSRGIEPPCIASAMMYLHDFEQLWDSINAKRGHSWESNPWVWAVTFRPSSPLSAPPAHHPTTTQE